MPIKPRTVSVVVATVLIALTAWSGSLALNLSNDESCAVTTERDARARIAELRETWDQLRSWVGGAVFQLDDDMLPTGTQLGSSKVVTLFRADQQRFVTPTYKQAWLDVTDRLDGRVHPLVRELSVTLYSDGWTMHRVWGNPPKPNFVASSTTWFRTATSKVELCYDAYSYHLTVRTDGPAFSATISAALADDWVPRDVILSNTLQQTHLQFGLTEVELRPNTTTLYGLTWLHTEALDETWIAVTFGRCTEWWYRALGFTALIGLVTMVCLIGADHHSRHSA